MAGRSAARTGARPGRTGRRPGEPRTRQAILEVARRSFAERGYEATSVRAIAREAGVDSALVHHYFGTKDALFARALELPIRPGDVADVLLGGDVDEVGERLVRLFFSVWGTPQSREPLLGLLRSAMTQERAAEMLRGFITDAFARVAERLGVTQATLRATLVGSHLVGLGLARYVIRVEPLASADEDAVVAWIAPSIQRYIAGDLPT